MEDARTEYDFRSYILEQLEKWEKSKEVQADGKVRPMSVVTVSSLPGSGGKVVARRIAEKMGFDLFEREIIQRIARSADISTAVVDTLEKHRLSGIEDFISSLVNKQYLWPGVYLDHLMRVIGVIGKHGNAVIVGRGANFILPPEERLAVRVVAPLETRVENISRDYEVPPEDARRRAINRESKRQAFIRKSFNADVADPLNYDLVLNMEHLSMEEAMEAVTAVLMKKGCKPVDWGSSTGAV
ncbi:MAG: cytidylate kinase-like family protein [Deltaproteobacteria bacterium]|nr:cytidylate kinase-like family protein [Deltaproteobacteria bacterium]MBW1956402.1 cytidylate kinase-like family protein [Deltaproteobacteria bacterium]MBW2041358.1 cytidylate kinase-like family protein [Deltaproteobacteria bacterium]MBW2131512.1 cytidylate kinase-like family protein [Deltaproteobacteria bacterium]